MRYYGSPKQMIPADGWFYLLDDGHALKKEPLVAWALVPIYSRPPEDVPPGEDFSSYYIEDLIVGMGFDEASVCPVNELDGFYGYECVRVSVVESTA